MGKIKMQFNVKDNSLDDIESSINNFLNDNSYYYLLNISERFNVITVTLKGNNGHKNESCIDYSQVPLRKCKIVDKQYHYNKKRDAPDSVYHIIAKFQLEKYKVLYFEISKRAYALYLRATQFVNIEDTAFYYSRYSQVSSNRLNKNNCKSKSSYHSKKSNHHKPSNNPATNAQLKYLTRLNATINIPDFVGIRNVRTSKEANYWIHVALAKGANKGIW